MGYVVCFGECAHCHKMFSFNPELVPSILIQGNKEPLCRACVEWANPQRKAKGLLEIKILPGAYEPGEAE